MSFLFEFIWIINVYSQSDGDVKTAESTFVSLVQSLLKDPAERAYFFKVGLTNVYPLKFIFLLLLLL